MALCALPPPLVAILETMTATPYAPAKQNALKDQDSSTVKHLLSVFGRYCAIVAADSCALLPRKNLRQDKHARMNLTEPSHALSESGRLRSEGLMGMGLGGARAAGVIGWPHALE
eukprot:SAG31_NODE_1040_length_10203_cov_3.045428_2_plen_115_part_00